MPVLTSHPAGNLPSAWRGLTAATFAERSTAIGDAAG